MSEIDLNVLDIGGFAPDVLKARDEAIAAAQNRVAKSGDTMTGPLELAGDASGDLEAVPKQQAEAIADARVSALTKADIGLGSVNNTADADKPVSSAVSAALALKMDASQEASIIAAAQAGSLADANRAEAAASIATALSTSAVTSTALAAGAIRARPYGDIHIPITVADPATGDDTGVLAGWDSYGRFRSKFAPDDLLNAVSAFQSEPGTFPGTTKFAWALSYGGKIAMGHRADNGAFVCPNLTSPDGDEVVVGSRQPAAYVSSGNVMLADGGGTLAVGGSQPWLTAQSYYRVIIAARQKALKGSVSTYAIERAAPTVGARLVFPTDKNLAILVLALGQSLDEGSNGLGAGDAGAESGTERYFKEPTYPGYALMFETNNGASDVRCNSNRANGSQPFQIDGNTIVGFTDLISKQYTTSSMGQTMLESFVDCALGDCTTRLGFTPRMVACSLGVGGASILSWRKIPQQSLPGGVLYNDLLTVLPKFKALCDARGWIGVVGYILWAQGYAGSGTAAYAQQLRDLQDEVAADVQSIMGQAGSPRWVFFQPTFVDATSPYQASGGPYSALGHIALAKEGRGSFARPSYAALHDVSGNANNGFADDYLHHSTAGYRGDGESGWLAVSADEAGATPRRCSPISATWNAGTGKATVQFELETAPIQLLSAGHTDCPANYGIRAFNSGGTELTVTAVTVNGSSALDVTITGGTPAEIWTGGKGYVSDFVTQGSKYLRSDVPRVGIHDSAANVSRYDATPHWNWCAHEKVIVT